MKEETHSCLSLVSVAAFPATNTARATVFRRRIFDVARFPKFGRAVAISPSLLIEVEFFELQLGMSHFDDDYFSGKFIIF